MEVDLKGSGEQSQEENHRSPFPVIELRGKLFLQRSHSCWSRLNDQYWSPVGIPITHRFDVFFLLREELWLLPSVESLQQQW